MNNHSIDYTEWTSACLPRGRISTTCAKSVLRNHIKCKYIFKSPKLDSAAQGLIVAHWHHLVIGIWVNLGSGNGLLPVGTKPLPKPMLTNHQWGLVPFTWGQFHRKYSRYKLDICLKITNLRLQTHLQGTNELISHVPGLDNIVA